MINMNSKKKFIFRNVVDTSLISLFTLSLNTATTVRVATLSAMQYIFVYKLIFNRLHEFLAKEIRIEFLNSLLF